MKILIVDDNRDDLNILRYALEAYGHEVVTAGNGEEGLRMASSVSPDLIVSDVLMPVMDGFEFLRNVRKTSSIPFIFYSAVYDGVRDKQFAASLGADAYLVKPKDPMEVMAHIERALCEGRRPLPSPIAGDEEFLRTHCRVVVAKLEEKALELEKVLAERKLAGEALAAREREFRTLAENSPDNIVRYDTSCRAIYINPRMERTLGMPADLILGRTPMEKPPGGERREYQERIERVIATGGDADIDIVLPDTGDGERLHNIRFVAEHGPNGEITGVLAIGRDITERKRIENMLRFIAQRGWMNNAENFLVVLARYLGETLGVDYVVVDRLAECPGSAETVALYAKGDIVPNMVYCLKGTPCENVMGRSLCVYPHRVRAQFPDDGLLVEMGVESYAGIPLWDSGGRPIGLIAVMDGKPMTGEKSIGQILQLAATSAAAALESERNNRMLKAREMEFRALSENSPDNVARYDTLCRVTYVNPQLERTLQLPAAAMLGATPMEIFPAGEFREYQETIERVLATGMEAQLELVLPDAGEGVRHHHIRFVAERDHDGVITGVLAIGRDITGRIQYEALLLERAEQEARLSSFVNNAPGFFYTLIMHPDGSAAIPFASAGIKELFGIDPEEVTENVEAFVARTHPDDLDMLIRKTLDSAQNLTPFHVEYRIIHADKGERWMECRSMPQREPDGGTRMHGFMHDITDRKWAEEQLREKQRHLNAMTLELSLAEERERRAIATELHDQIGQDLTLARIKLGVLARNPESEQTVRLLGETREILDRMIHEVRALTRRISPPILESGSLEAALKWLARQIGADYGLDVRFCDDMSDKPLSEEFRAVVYHAVRELLINAAKHARATTVRLTVGRRDDSFVVEVEDDGVGFDAAGISENRTIGDGFGLFNVRRRICHLGGRFAIESSSVSGTRVTIGMPLSGNGTDFTKENCDEFQSPSGR